MSLPTIEMPTPIKSNIIDVIEENLLASDEQDEEDQQGQGSEDDIVHVSPREGIAEEDVFEPPPVIKKLKISDDVDVIPTESSVSSEIGQVESTKKKGKRAYNRKQPMSEKQKAHLTRIRVKAQETRTRKAAERKLERESQDELKAEERLLVKKELQKKKKQVKLKIKETDEFLTSETDDPQPPPAPRPRTKEVKTTSPQPSAGAASYSQESLDQAVFNGIQQYDNQRKQQKKIKKVQQQKDAIEQKKIQVIQNAIQPQQGPDPWRALFS